MPKTRFYLKAEINRDGEALIYARFFVRPRNLTLSTGESIKPAHWNENTQRARKNAPDAESLNTILDNIAADIEAAAKKLKAEKKPVTRESIRAAIEKTGTGKNQAQEIAAYAVFIASTKDANSAKSYNTLAAQVNDFTRSTRRGKTFEELDTVWFRDFRQFLLDKKLASSTVSKMLSVLKTVTKHAILYEVTANAKILLHPIEVGTQGATAISLSLEEIKAFADAPLTDTRLEKVRDCFVCACLTGLRISDWGKLTTDPAHVVTAAGREYCRIHTQKTGVVVHVPLFPIVQTILTKYGGRLPIITEQKTNIFLKDAAQVAGFTDTITKSIQSGKNSSSEQLPRFAMFSAHTARRSFVTVCRALGVPDNLIGEITGHSKKRSVTDIYDKAGFEQKAERLEPYLRKIEAVFPSDFTPIKFLDDTHLIF